MTAMRNKAIAMRMLQAVGIMMALTGAAYAAPGATPQNQVRKETIVRNDTVTHVDTIITTRKVRRTEVIQRVEEVIYSDSVSLSDGNIIVTVDDQGRMTGVPAQAPVVIPVQASTSTPVETPVQVSSIVSDTVSKAPVEEVKTIEKVIVKVVEPQTMEFDPNEKVTFRGDTLSMVLRDRNWGRFDRGLFNYLFIPKGIWSIGVTASYGEFSTKDLEVLDLMSDIDFSGHTFSIRPYFSYFIGNNRSVGMRLGYNSGRADIGSFKVDIDEDMNFNLHDISYRSESYTAAVTYNQYFGLTRRGRFGIFNEVELAFSSGNSDFVRPYAGELKTTHTDTMQAALNFSPGVSVFIMDPVTFNISFGVFGVSLRNEKQTVDGEDMGSRFTSGANFRFNIFNISFGIAVNL